jgi:hypothetical protein
MFLSLQERRKYCTVKGIGGIIAEMWEFLAHP